MFILFLFLRMVRGHFHKRKTGKMIFNFLKDDSSGLETDIGIERREADWKK